MSPWIIAVLIVTWAARDAQADRSITVDAVGFAGQADEGEGGRPFTPEELAAAIRVRIAADGGPVQVKVTPIASGVRIEARGEARDVSLGALRGADAARMVALVAQDLLVDDLAAPPAPLPPLAAPAPRDAVRREARAPRASRAPDDRAALGVLGELSGWDGSLAGLSLELAIPRGDEAITVEAGGGVLVDSALHLLAGHVRVDPALRVDRFELRAGATIAPVLVTNGIGDQTVLVGGNASVRVRVELGAATRAVLAIGLDAYATHTQYRIAAMTIATPWLAPWLGGGIEVSL